MPLETGEKSANIAKSLTFRQNWLFSFIWIILWVHFWIGYLISQTKYVINTRSYMECDIYYTRIIVSNCDKITFNSVPKFRLYLYFLTSHNVYTFHNSDHPFCFIVCDTLFFLLFLVLFKNFVEKFRTALNFKCQIC